MTTLYLFHNMAKMSLWRINRWYGGMSTGDKVGIDGSFAFGQGLDFRTNPDLLSPNYAMAKASSTNVTEIPRWFAQNGTTYYAYCYDGKIHSDATSWTSLRTVANSTGQGMAVFNDYLYYAQNAQLGRYGALSGSPSFTDNYQTLDTDTSYHPCKVFLNKLCVGHARKIATLDDSATWTDAAITLPIGWKVKCLEVRGDFLYIGAWKGTNIYDYEEGALFIWDGTSATWNSVEFINESGVNAILNHNDSLFIWAGTRGNIYQFANGQYVKIKRVPNIGAGKYADIGPGAVTSWNGIVHFGTSFATDSATLYQGVYTWGQAEKNYPNVLNYDYPISSGTVQGSTLAIGAVKAVSPTKLLVGWQDNTVFGIDLISTSVKQTGVIMESLIWDGKEPYRRKTIRDIKLLTTTLSAGQQVVIKYKADRASSWITLDTFSHTTHGAVNTRKFVFKSTADVFVKCYELQIRLELTGCSLVEAAILYETEEDIV